MNKWVRVVLVIMVGMIPKISFGQGLSGELGGLQQVLAQLYNEMMPLCSQLIGVGRGIAGFAATWYIASRVWGHIARAEPIDFYPLFRPFVIGFAILIFPSIIALINAVMQPAVSATSAMVDNSDKAITVLLKQKEEAINKQVYGRCMLAIVGAETEINGMPIRIRMIQMATMKVGFSL